MTEATSSYVRCLGLIIAIAVSPKFADSSYAAEPKNSTPRFTSSQAQPYELRGTQRRLLSRFDKYLEHSQWEDAFEIADQILAADSQAVIATQQNRYISVQENCRQQLANLPEQALAEYRALVDAPAEQWYRKGIANRDEQQLQRVVDEAFCSQWGDEALNALGELSLEQGDYQAARRFWSSISSSLQRADEPARLTYPDTNLKLAAIQARLVLVSLREGNLTRAQNEIENLFVKHGDAKGRLGGREVIYTEALEELLNQARSWPASTQQSAWPTYGGAPNRNNFSRARPPTAYKKIWSHKRSDEDNQQLNTFPMVTENLVICQEASQVQALYLDSGQVAFTSRGTAFESINKLSKNQQSSNKTLMSSGQFVFGTTTKSTGRRQSQVPSLDSLLWGVDLNRDGALSLRTKMPEPEVQFTDAPLIVDSLMFVAIRSDGHTARAGVACFDLATNQLLWQQWICQTRGVAPVSLNTGTSNLLAYDSGIVYSCTNLGAIAALRARDGQVQWINTYQRASLMTGMGDGVAQFRLPNPCVFHHGTLFVAPTDSDTLIALQADTGSMFWQYEMTSLTGEIVGVADNNVYISDQGLRVVNAITGEAKTLNPDLRLFGQPAVTSNLICWPSYEKIEFIDTTTGNVLEQSLPLAEQGGANLILIADYLIAAGRTQITVYQHTEKPGETIQSTQVPD